MRIIARLSKGVEVRFISHLDMQRALQRALRRAGVPVAYSMGFNPHPQLSFATALSVGVTSEAEWIDVRLAAPIAPEAFVSAMNGVLPVGLHIEDAREFPDDSQSLTALTVAADYRVAVQTADAAGLAAALERLLGGAIVVMKKTKSGVKPVDIRPALLSARIEAGDASAQLFLGGRLDSTFSFSAELFMGALMSGWGMTAPYMIHRVKVIFADGVK